MTHEDDPERAVRAGLRILEAIDELSEDEELDLSVRAAVATGEAVVQLGAQAGTGEGIATGDVVNIAARLQGQAPVGRPDRQRAGISSDETGDPLRGAPGARAQG